MTSPFLGNPLLHRYWFRTGSVSGFGVTAYSWEDARGLLRQNGWSADVLDEITDVIEDVDVSSLDSSHVLGNLGPPNLRGVWYPCMNLHG